MPKITKELLQSYLFDHTNKEAAVYFGVSLRTIAKKVKDFGFSYYQLKYPNLPDYLDEEQSQIMTACLLGDGHIRSYGVFQFGQKYANKEYVQWLFEKFKPFSKHHYKTTEKVKGKSFDRYRMYTIRNKAFDELRLKWYGKVKKIPNDILLNPLIFYHWFVQEGNNNQQKKSIGLSTNCFKLNEVEKLVHLIKRDLGIESTIHNKNKQPVINIGAYEYFKVIEILKPLSFFECFNYKTDTSNVKEKSENSGACKLNMEIARIIRKEYKKGISVVSLAKQWNVRISSIYNVINGLTYQEKDVASVSVIYKV